MGIFPSKRVEIKSNPCVAQCGCLGNDNNNNNNNNNNSGACIHRLYTPLGPEGYIIGGVSVAWWEVEGEAEEAGSYDAADAAAAPQAYNKSAATRELVMGNYTSSHDGALTNSSPSG